MSRGEESACDEVFPNIQDRLTSQKPIKTAKEREFLILQPPTPRHKRALNQFSLVPSAHAKACLVFSGLEASDRCAV